MNDAAAVPDEGDVPDGPERPADEPVGGAVDEPAYDPAYDLAAPAPLEVPRTPTGNADVDAALDRLADADHLATDGHVEVYEDVYRGLRDALTALDARPGPPAPPSTYGNRS
ncbi:hypothetical protein SUDANB105_05876 [Streptomyces sp. enrichment culture]|uniref:hypothetical protein n=1 Tax=Streptomyces sp. enrichment culture TaxID=1795815 RepID=UPI003F56434A